LLKLSITPKTGGKPKASPPLIPCPRPRAKGLVGMSVCASVCQVGKSENYISTVVGKSSAFAAAFVSPPYVTRPN